MNSVYMTLDCKALNATDDSSSWSREQEKAFENAVAHHCNESGDRWEQISLSVQGKSVAEVKHHYDLLVDDIQSIESGRIPLPAYASASSSSAYPDVFGDTHYESLQISPEAGLPAAGKTGSRSEQERRKGIAWTEEEHRLFLLGLEKYGKGDWRSISRNFVISRTPTPVASHAQKYFIRRNSVNKDKRRSSIHDITNVGAGDGSHEASITAESNGVGMPSGKTPASTAQPLSSAPVVGVYGTPISQPIGISLAVGTPVNLPSDHMAYGIRAPVAGIIPGVPMNPTSMAYPSPQASSAQR